MALRKMKKSMKPLVLLFVVAFVLTIVAAGVMGLGNKTPYAFKLNGKKVEIQEVDKALKRGIDSVTQQVGQGVLDEQELKVLFFDQVIEIQLLLQEADELKVKVSDADVNAEYEKIKGQFQTKEEFETWQQRTGYTKMTLTEDIKKQLIIEKAKEAISKDAKVSDDELKSYYEENKYNTYFAGKTFDSVKEELKKTLLQAKEGKVYRAWKEKKMAEAKLDFPKINKAENPYKALQRKVVYEKEGFKFTNVDFVNRGFSFTMQGVKDKATVDKMIKENIDKELKIVAKAKAANVKVDETLAQEDKMSSYVEEYQKYLIKTTKVSEEDLQKYFAENTAKYDTAETFDVQMIQLEIKASPADEAEAKAQAEKILKEVQGGANFEELATKYSEDGGSASQGGALGWFKKGQMVAPFEEAAFAGEKGKVVPKVVKSDFGYHIIKVIDKKADGSEVDASHILIQTKIGEATKTAVAKKAQDLADKIAKNELTFEKAAKENSVLGEKSEFKGLKKEQLSGIDTILEKGIETAELNKVNTVLTTDKVFIYKKTGYVPYKQAVFTEVKDRVNYDLVRTKVMEEMQKLYQ